MSASAPLVSVLMANRNAAERAGAAVRSVLRQTERSLELLFSDDASTDASVARAREAAAGDARLHILESAVRGGPAAARNRALAQARGAWIGVVDSDDVIHPERLERLIKSAERDGADIAADDLLVCCEDRERPPHAHLRGALARRPAWISAARFMRNGVLYGREPGLGYLKPVIRRSALLEKAAAYDESLRIAEDFDLIVRLLIAGARMRIYPDLGYFYYRSKRSHSHRLAAADIEAMIKAHDGLHAPPEPRLRAAMAVRRNSLLAALAYETAVRALKAGDVFAAARAIGARPSALPLLRLPLQARLMRWLQPAKQRALGGSRIALVSRQRIVGAVNGSSAYVLSIARALKSAGFAVDFIGASPKIFGRWPVLRLRPETAVFDSYAVRGGVRIGPFIIALDLGVPMKAALAALEFVLAKLRLRRAGWAAPAPYAVAAAPTRADQLFVARRGRAHTRAVLCDYAFLAPMAPYALAPDAPALVIMHDLMSARRNLPGEERVAEEIAALDAAAEFRLLSLADAVIAIQPEECAEVRRRLPMVETLLAPMAVRPVSRVEPGRDDLLLFVGSNTAPNITGLNWFFARVWPRVRSARPNAQLWAAGSVCRGVREAPEGVRMLGIVGALEPLYRDAGIVISPLLTGSGLKIKLVEAMAAGKAIVATRESARGVAELVDAAVALADDAGAFASAVCALLADAHARAEAGAAALRCATERFSEAACYGPLVDYVRRPVAAAGARTAAPARAQT